MSDKSYIWPCRLFLLVIYWNLLNSCAVSIRQKSLVVLSELKKAFAPKGLFIATQLNVE